MASTSTNKQPLLIDRPLHKLMNMSQQKTGNAGYWLSNNSCDVLVDCTQNDGAFLEDIYLISRDTGDHAISLFLGLPLTCYVKVMLLTVLFCRKI